MDKRSLAVWFAHQQSQADAPPTRPRDALWLAAAGVQIGSIERAVGRRLLDAGLPVCLATDGWLVNGSHEALARIARWMNANGLGGRWRDELLAVTDPQGQVVSHIERAAVRPLGITSFAVHLVVHAEEGGSWVQQRALDKATDPGLWDTTMGGLVAGGETVQQALERETWEEAGLHLAHLRGLSPLGRITIRRPVDAHGYMVEHIDVFEATAPAGVVPQNQDGEVLRFERVERDALRARLLRGEFTLEAGLILGRWLQA